MHLHREHLGLEPVAVADGARHLAQVLGPALALGVGLCLGVLPLDVGHDAFEPRRVAHLAPVAVLPLHRDLVALAAQHRVLHGCRQVAPRRVEREVEVVGETDEQPLVVLVEALALRRPRDDDALVDRELIVAQHEFDVDRHTGAEARARGARAEGRVEREGARFDLGQLKRVPVRAGELLAEALPCVVALFVDEVDLHDAAGEPERRLDRVGDAAEDVGRGHEPVDDDGDVVLVALLEGRRFGELDQVTVDDGARVALRRQLFEEVDELALLLRHDGSDDLIARALGQLHQLIGDLLHRLTLDDGAAFGAVRHADARPQQTHVVVDLGDRADRRPRVAVGRLLVDRHRGAEPLDEVDIGAVDLSEELARVGAQRLDVAALALGEDRVEREARLARAGQPREHHERVARNVEVDVLEVVDAGSADAEFRAGDGDDRHPTILGGASDIGPGVR